MTFRGVAARRLPVAAASALLVTCVLLSACSFGAPPPDQSGAPPRLPTPSTASSAESPGDPSSTLNVVATKLNAPWGMTFLRDGSGLVTERRTGKILKIGEPVTRNGLSVAPMATVRGINVSGDGGLLGIAASPHFDTDKTAYIFYSTGTDNRIASLRLEGDSSPHVILSGLPRASTHNGGALAFGPDGYLYASVGDASGKPGTVKHKDLAGKILRMTTTGLPVKGATSLAYASGFHDVEGIAWDQAGHMFAVDASAAAAAKDKLLGVSKSGAKALQTWDPADSTCAGVAVIGYLLATGCLLGERIWVVNLTPAGGTLGAPVDALKGTYGRLRGVGAAPDGSLWVMTSNTDGHGHPQPDDDQILRIVLATSGVGMS